MKVTDLFNDVDADFVLDAILKHNYFPMQKEDRDELPTIFTSISLTPKIAHDLIAGKKRLKDGFDVVEYKLTRFNGVSRICSIPHPVAYADLAVCIYDNWDSLNYIVENENSMIKPRRHDDGRIIIMDYESSKMKNRRELQSMFSRRFMVKTDISNCFPNIYSHAAIWAIVGFAKGKKAKNNKAEWFNQLDEKIRWLKRNETQGIPIGPASSNIISETILARVDEELRRHSPYVRFIDDYTAYFGTDEEARNFVRELEDKLSKYKLLLNAKKTEIVELPQPLEPNWISELTLRLPKTRDTGKIPRHEAIRFLNYAVDLAKQSPDGSVIKYALRSLLKQSLEDDAKVDVLHYALQLCFHNPILIPLLENLLKSFDKDATHEYTPQLEQLTLKNALYHHSDGMVWTLNYINMNQVEIGDDTASKILETQDSLAILMLYLSKNENYKKNVIEFATNIISRGDNYEIDQHWLLLYQLFLDGRIQNPYSDEDSFEILKNAGVSFINDSI
jgi:hypothetical protein